MLTGDKGETAKSIAISCGLIDLGKDTVLEIDGTDKKQVSDQLEKAKNQVESLIETRDINLKLVHDKNYQGVATSKNSRQFAI